MQITRRVKIKKILRRFFCTEFMLRREGAAGRSMNREFMKNNKRLEKERTHDVKNKDKDDHNNNRNYCL